jgi:ERCC4-type nuclease
MSILTIITDTREQRPFDFSKFDLPVAIQTLREGDYSVVGLEGRVAIERKSGSDLYGCMTSGRDRFERELDRLRGYEFSAVVVECLEQEFFTGCFGQMNPRSIKATFCAWTVRYPTRWVFCPTRAWAERTAYMLLERFWRDVQDGKRDAAGQVMAASA